MKLPREFYIPKSSMMIVRAKNADAVVYVSSGGKPTAIGFAGKAQKPSFHYSFRTEERRAAYVAEFFARCEAIEKSRTERRASRKAFRHTLKVGDILQSSWGYDQTNVEFYEIVGLIGAAMVSVREIAQEAEETGYMSGKCVPVPGKYISEPQRKRVLPGNALDMHNASFGRAYPVEMREVAPGVKVANAAHWSSYA